MNTSRKLSLMIIFAFGAQLVTQAYDVDKLADKTENIVEFSQKIRQINNFKINSVAHDVAQWLNEKVMSKYNVQDSEIITITNIINNSELTTESKITIFYETMQKEATDKKNGIIEGIAVGTLIAGIIAGALTFIFKMNQLAHQPRTIVITKSLFGRTTSTSTFHSV